MPDARAEARHLLGVHATAEQDAEARRIHCRVGRRAVAAGRDRPARDAAKSLVADRPVSERQVARGRTLLVLLERSLRAIDVVPE